MPLLASVIDTDGLLKDEARAGRRLCGSEVFKPGRPRLSAAATFASYFVECGL